MSTVNFIIKKNLVVKMATGGAALRGVSNGWVGGWMGVSWGSTHRHTYTHIQLSIYICSLLV